MSMKGTILHCPFCGHHVGCAKGNAVYHKAVEGFPSIPDGFDYRRCPNARCKTWLKFEIVAVYEIPQPALALVA